MKVERRKEREGSVKRVEGGEKIKGEKSGRRVVKGRKRRNKKRERERRKSGERGGWN